MPMLLQEGGVRLCNVNVGFTRILYFAHETLALKCLCLYNKELIESCLVFDYSLALKF